MELIFNKSGDLVIKRGEALFRGSKGANYVIVGWAKDEEPDIPLARLGADINITYPDSTQSGWQDMTPHTNNNKWFYYKAQGKDLEQDGVAVVNEAAVEANMDGVKEAAEACPVGAIEV